MNPKIKNRLLLLLIAFICLVPLVLAHLLYRNPQWLSERSVNYGRLVAPPVPVGETLRALGSGEAGGLGGRWLLLVVSGTKGCDAECASSLDNVGRVHALLNKDIARLRRGLLVWPGAPAPAASPAPDVPLLSLTPEAWGVVQSRMGGQAEAGAVLLLDPLRNWVLWYDPAFDPFGLLKDVQRLLRISQIG